MSSLILSLENIKQVKQSWADLQANNRYHKDEFVSRLFGNLLAANPDLRSVLTNEKSIREQSKLFNHMLSFSIMYIDNLQLLDDCMAEFISENPSIVTVGVKYLEQMGSALITTFRQWLGKGKFHAGLETLWIKIYIYLANSILQHDDSSDSESIMSNDSFKECSSEEEPIEPLQPKSPLRYKQLPSTPVQPQEPQETEATEEAPEEVPATPSKDLLRSPAPSVFSSNTLLISLSSNEKYKGFRRSKNCEVEPVQIEIPSKLSTTAFISSFSAPTVPTEPFDPRKLRRGSSSPSSIKEEEEYEEPVITPRSSRRNSVLSVPSTPTKDPRKLQMTRQANIITDDSDDEFDNEKSKDVGFDPRRRHSKPVEKADTYELAASRLSEDSASEVEDVYNLNDSNDDLIDFSQVEITSKPAMFDSNSFGIQGLAPIVEDSDDGSSRYESDNEVQDTSSSYDANTDKSSSDELSTLSLHNSDYKSSISSGTEADNSPYMNKFQMGHQSKPSEASDISYMKPLPRANKAPSVNNVYNSRFSSSTPSLCGTQRASLGFMRSSFVLKKELETLGYNEPENVFVKPPTLPAAMASTPALHKISNMESSTTLGCSSEGSSCFDLINAFAPETKKSMSSRSTINLGSKAGSIKSKKSFMLRLGSMFSSKPQQLPASTKPVTSSIGVPASVPQQKTFAATSYSSTTASIAPTMGQTSRQAPGAPSVKAKSSSSRMSRKTSMTCPLVSDVVSVRTTETSRTTISGFSFFSRRKSLMIDNRESLYTNRRRRGNKYNITSCSHDLFAKA